MRIANIFDIILKNHQKSKDNIFSDWPQIVKKAFSTNGSSITEETIINTIDSSKLYDVINDKIIVEVKHSGWKQIILTKQSEILELVHNQYNLKNVQTIKFILSKDKVTR